jgi:hypothetical protein
MLELTVLALTTQMPAILVISPIGEWHSLDHSLIDFSKTILRHL